MRPLSAVFTRKQKRAGGRRRAERGWSPRRRAITVAVLAILAGAGVTGGGWWLVSSGTVARGLAALGEGVDRRMVAAGFAVRDVFVAGRGQLTREQVLASLGTELGEPILNFDPDAARERLLEMGWVRDARVERRLPDTIIVRLEERQPLALWQQHGQHVLIDREGVPITRQNLGRFASLPVVIGEDAPLHAAHLIDLLSREPVLFAQVEAAVRVGGRRWTLKLKNQIDVNLPEEGEAAAWARLVDLVETQGIFEREIAVIDLRLPDRLVLRLTPEAAAARQKKSGKDT
jgi:cell division protein FtsQ